MKLPRLSRPSGGDSSTTQMILSAPSSRQMALLRFAGPAAAGQTRPDATFKESTAS